jgi:hypothetical protein
MGDLMCYDGVMKQSLCVKCGQAQNRSDLIAVEPPCEMQNIMDRIKMLNQLPKPHSESVSAELIELESRLEDYACKDAQVKKTLLRTRIGGSIKAITAKYAGKCAGCQMAQQMGDAVAYDTLERKMYCYGCAGNANLASSPSR